MSVSVANVQASAVPGAEVRTVKTVTFDSSYQSEGEPLTAAQLGLKSVDFAICQVTNGTENESEFPVAEAYYTPSTEKIHLISAKTSKEIASTKNVEKVTVQVVAFGKLA